MLIYNRDDIKIYACALALDTPGRCEGRLIAERKAVDSLVREALSDYPSVCIAHRPDGSPYLTDRPENTGKTIYPAISVSHCRTMAAIILTPPSLSPGIDCETRDRSHTLLKVAARYLSPSQLKDWASSPERLLRAWCIKEAIYKALRIEGLPLADIPLPPADKADATETTVTMAGRSLTLITLPDFNSTPVTAVF
ncbi:MAG: 4'-phosphopantetheinyl transferase superfamily protein [Muribaculaceae bacterium]|nr:4'-phosphopantetheinyl transferase superfamily protein [Muribaculaceae bacterium]